VTGSLEATCLDEGATLEVSGSFVRAASSAPGAVARAEPFFARTPEKSGDEQERYYAALVATSSPGHACAPFVEVLQTMPRPTGRSAVLYTMRYPCEEKEAPYGSEPGAAPSPTRHAYVADVTEAEPPRAVASTVWAPLGDPDEPNELNFHLNPVELAPGFELYVATLWDRFQSPVTSASGTTVSNVAWAVAADGRHGKPVELPDMHGGHAGVCHAVSVARELWLTDLDGDKRPELVARTLTETMAQTGKPGPDGFVPCVKQPQEIGFVAFTLDPGTLAWTPYTLPKKRVTETQLAVGRKIQVL
jgi:hypothetical protein